MTNLDIVENKISSVKEVSQNFRTPQNYFLFCHFGFFSVLFKFL